jgi:hypothetical protein
MYIFISIVYVQSFYKVLRLRLLNYKFLSNIIKKQDYSTYKILDIFKEIKKFLFNNFKSFKIKIIKNSNQNLVK